MSFYEREFNADIAEISHKFQNNYYFNIGNTTK